jgi:hypothetical protein
MPRSGDAHANNTRTDALADAHANNTRTDALADARTHHRAGCCAVGYELLRLPSSALSTMGCAFNYLEYHLNTAFELP